MSTTDLDLQCLLLVITSNIQSFESYLLLLPGHMCENDSVGCEDAVSEVRK